MRALGLHAQPLAFLYPCPSTSAQAALVQYQSLVGSPNLRRAGPARALWS